MKPTLVFIPGWGADASLFAHQIQSLEPLIPCQVIILDHQNSREEMVAHILKLAPPKFILAGQSMGGWVALQLAAMAPERLLGLILINTWASPDPKLNALQTEVLRDLKNGSIEQVVERHLPFVLHPQSMKNLKLVEQMKQMFTSDRTVVLINQMEAMLKDYASTQLLPKIKAPTLIIHGKQDLLFPTTEQEYMQKHIKGSTLKIIDNCGHLSPVEHPEKTTQLMREFIAKVLGKTAIG